MRPRLVPDSTPSEMLSIDDILRLPCLDYIAYQCLYTSLLEERSLALIVVSASGTIICRRVTAGRIRETQKLRNALECAVWLDMGDDDRMQWVRDRDEEELWRESDRQLLDEVEGEASDD